MCVCIYVGSGLCDELITHSEESYCVCIYVGNGLCDELITHSEESYCLCIYVCVYANQIVYDLET